jgi:tetratricopeptide (TPR) repeat protein
MNEREAAETARNATFRFAQDVGHAELIAWSHELQTWFALTEGRFSDATSIASRAQAEGGENSAVVQLIMQEARGWARLGNRASAERAIERGYALLQKLPAADYPRHFIYDRTKFPFYVASCYQWLGDDEQAEKYANQVFKECAENGTMERSPMRLADTNITLGFVHVRRRNLDGAVDYGSRALSYNRKCGPSLLIRAAELNKAIVGNFPATHGAHDFDEMYKAVSDEFKLQGSDDED